MAHWSHRCRFSNPKPTEASQIVLILRFYSKFLCWRSRPSIVYVVYLFGLFLPDLFERHHPSELRVKQREILRYCEEQSLSVTEQRPKKNSTFLSGQSCSYTRVSCFPLWKASVLSGSG